MFYPYCPSVTVHNVHTIFKEHQKQSMNEHFKIMTMRLSVLLYIYILALLYIYIYMSSIVCFNHCDTYNNVLSQAFHSVEITFNREYHPDIKLIRSLPTACFVEENCTVEISYLLSNHLNVEKIRNFTNGILKIQMQGKY
jgi:hypothetical protein